MKNISNTASVRHNSNMVISTTEDNWNSLMLGSLIQFGNDKVMYEVANKEPLFAVKSFTNDGSYITTPPDPGNTILPNDCVSISYKLHEIKTVLAIVSAGKDYLKDQIVTLSGGIAQKNVVDNQESNVKIQITEVGKKGDIKKISILEPGRYVRAPEETVEIVGGTGKNCILKVNYGLLEERALIERIVTKVESTSAFVRLNFNIPIPREIKEGKISVNKWKLYLSTNYAGATAYNIPYEIINDYFPNSTIPILTRNSRCQEQIFNLAIRRLLARIVELENKVNTLSK